MRGGAGGWVRVPGGAASPAQRTSGTDSDGAQPAGTQPAGSGNQPRPCGNDGHKGRGSQASNDGPAGNDGQTGNDGCGYRTGRTNNDSRGRSELASVLVQ
jgi:hypothetical protein